MHHSNGGAEANDVGHKPSVEVYTTFARVIPEGEEADVYMP